jgi:hypothetical protein
VIAGDIYDIHVVQTVQESPASGHDGVKGISEQFEKVTGDDQLPVLVFDMSEERVEEWFAICPAQVIARGSVPDVEIADDKDRFVLVDMAALYYSIGWLGLSPRSAPLQARVSASHVKPLFRLR